MITMISKNKIYNYFLYYSQYIFYEIILLIFLIVLFLSEPPRSQTQNILMILFSSILAALLGIIFGIGLPNLKNTSIFWSSSQYQFLHNFTFKIIWIFAAGIILPPLSIGCLPFSNIGVQKILYKVNFSIFFICILILVPYIKSMFFLQDKIFLIQNIKGKISILTNLNKDSSLIDKHIQDIILIIQNMSNDTRKFREGLELLKEDKNIIESIITLVAKL